MAPELHTELNEVPPFEFYRLGEFEEAEGIIKDALAYSGIDPETAPVRYVAAEKAAAYAVYVATGITGHHLLRQTAGKYLKGRRWKNRLREVDRIARFEDKRYEEQADAIRRGEQ